jgi:hypothetical protein
VKYFSNGVTAAIFDQAIRIDKHVPQSCGQAFADGGFSRGHESG